jgi:putative ABC transport system ATP-binding protein/macrolide transport system ATP-binding/permease protein/lipoprotein-releasing system ATP-binding protein
MLGALTRPTEGKVLLDGADVWMLAESELADFRCRQIGFIFQFASLLPNLSAVDNVALPALLGRTMDAQAAYARAYHLLAQVGLAQRADAYPAAISGGEQRRVAVARALINSPRLLLADEPTSDLDEDTEADIIEHLQHTHAFGLALVTHNLEIANRAQRKYEMRQGVLMPSERPELSRAPPDRRRQFGSVSPLASEPIEPAAARAPIRLGRNLRHQLQTLMLVGVIILAGIALLDFGVGRYQAMQVRERSAQLARLRHMALNGLRGDVQSIRELGGGRYELTTYLQNVSDGTPIYVMSPEFQTSGIIQ